jgi:para-aminobenzoate synthetase
VKTGTGGIDVLSNFWRIAQDWSKENGRVTTPWSEANQKAIPAWPNVEVHKPLTAPEDFPKVASRVVPVSESSLIALCETMGAASLDSPFVFLDSAGAEPGRFSIIGCLHDASTRISFKMGENHLDIIDGNGARKEPTKGDAWAWISAFMRTKRYSSGAPEVPFWGGLIGFISYEIGVRGLDVSALRKYPGAQHPDISLVFVDRSLVYDKEKGVLHIQSLLPADDAWLEETANTVTSLPVTKPAAIEPTGDDVHIVYPDMDTYVARVKECQEYLKAGESYELCLTAQTTVTLPPKSKLNDSWELYKAARARNPAPHSAYMRLAPSTLVSTSPERFLSFSRPPHTVLQLRPIKGTVRKTTHPTRASAESALAGSVKEVAENLMIVDLIRHDLHHVVGSNVDVPHFCVVEEYETVWQMVSVIEGRLAADADRSGEADLGWEVLRYSLPPGSMTGAPKKRSVDILQTMEDQQRDIYSGSFGYWDVAGGGDWAVCIRSTFKHDDEAADGTKGDTYKIGAGGAVTALSDPMGEWEEMVLKLGGILRAFE